MTTAAVVIPNAYVRNIFRYYIAYKMTIEQGELRKQAKAQLTKH
jgi:hypothetical protein